MVKMTPMTLTLNCNANLDPPNGRRIGFTHVQAQIMCKEILVLAAKRFIDIVGSKGWRSMRLTIRPEVVESARDQ